MKLGVFFSRCFGRKKSPQNCAFVPHARGWREKCSICIDIICFPLCMLLNTRNLLDLGGLGKQNEGLEVYLEEIRVV